MAYLRSKIIKLLVSHGANINEKDRWGKTPFHIASERNSIHTLKLLIKLGSNTNEENKNKKTPLHCAVERDALDTIKLLIGLNININVKDGQDQTPLDCLITDMITLARVVYGSETSSYIKEQYAAKIKTLKLLISFKADIIITTISGLTVLTSLRNSIPSITGIFISDIITA